MKVLIIGCGLIGRKRALALENSDTLAACCDIDPVIAEKFGNDFSCKYFTDYWQALQEVDSDVVIIAVVNKFVKEMVLEAIKHGKHILVEKPLGRNYSEASEMFSLSQSLSITKFSVFKTGFNHRFHPAIWKAKILCDKGGIGKIFTIRARYGHGGRPGMENEWRASKDLCGGGELLDQGVHVIDLIRWFGGEIKEVYGRVETKFWEMEVEDSASAILKTRNDITASFNVSWTNWKNIFSFEIFGTKGYLRIEGLGGSYGEETLEWGKRNPKGGKPEVQFFNFPPEDISWKEEWKEFKNAIHEKREVIGNVIDGLKANEVIAALYRSSNEKKVIIFD
ncbi:MAG: Gfo/Idh/MocA family oxidoreductase [Bacteroidetes bacterium]|nr:Gfo/Idh/MocA family oxidoreductase [Bacteroidota bacterium]